MSLWKTWIHRVGWWKAKQQQVYVLCPNYPLRSVSNLNSMISQSRVSKEVKGSCSKFKRCLDQRLLAEEAWVKKKACTHSKLSKMFLNLQAFNQRLSFFILSWKKCNGLYMNCVWWGLEGCISIILYSILLSIFGFDIWYAWCYLTASVDLSVCSPLHSELQSP